MGKRFERFVHRGSLLDGKLVLDNPKWFRGMLQQYDDAPVTVLVERRQSNPTSEQWGYLWGVVYEDISVETGHTPDELHEIFKALILSKKHVWRGTEVKTVPGASKLTMNELAEFITEVRRLAGEAGIETRDADPEYQFRDT